MRILLANHSSYPGTGREALQQALQSQSDAGLDLISEGQLGWEDPLTPPLAHLAGVRLGDMTTRPGIPFPFRRLVIEARLRRQRPLCVELLQRAAALTSQPLKVSVAGPLTIAHAATIATTAYRCEDAVADELSAILAQEVAALAEAGAAAVQIDEPAILSRPAEMRRLRALLEPIFDAAAGRCQIIVAAYGGDATDLYAQLNSLPADVIAVDCAGRPGVVDAIASTGSGKPLALGVVDGSTAQPADPDQLRRDVERMLSRYIHPTVWLQPSVGLGRLTPAESRAKLDSLAALRASLGN